jgi:hypothetical protein
VLWIGGLFALAVIVLMVAVALLRSRALGDTAAPPRPARERLKGALLYLNLELGVLVLLLSGMSAALAAGAPPV